MELDPFLRTNYLDDLAVIHVPEEYVRLQKLAVKSDKHFIE